MAVLDVLAGWKGYALVAVVAAALSGAGAWEAQGWRYEARIANMKTEQATAMRKAEARARDVETKNAELTEKIDKQYSDLAVAQVEANNLRVDLAAGRSRLSVRTTACRVPKATGTASVGDGTARADIDPTDASNIVRITGECDAAIRQLTALQQWVKQIREGQKK